MKEDLVETIFRGLLPDRDDRFNYLVANVNDEIFEGTHKTFWNIIWGVRRLTDTMVDDKSLSKVLDSHVRQGLSEEKRLEIEELWNRVAQRGNVTEPEFRWSVTSLNELLKESKFTDSLVTAAQIVSEGVDRRNVRIQGVDAAIDFIREGLSDIDLLNKTGMPSSDLTLDFKQLLQELYEDKTVKRIPTGILPVDEMMYGGVAGGELTIVGAGTGVGKSLLCTNIAQHACVQGYNVLYLTLETPLVQIRRRLAVRHAYSEKFGIGGISFKDLSNHIELGIKMDESTEKRYREAIDDLGGNEAYGKCYIVEVPEGANIDVIRSIANSWNNRVPLDLIIIDSLDLVGPTVKRPNRRDELNEVILAAKRMAMTFDKGRTIPIISPWQTSRDAFNKTKDQASMEGYSITSLGETAEIERRADCILALSHDTSSPSKIKLQTLKWRNGQPRNFDLRVEYDKCYMGSNESSNAKIDDIVLAI